jgi:glycosyltransferase involved in cell wall biosynthesis
MSEGRSLSILHVLRAPVGGLFRHVVDLARGQTARGHKVGVIADATGGGAQADATLDELARTLALGVTRLPMSRRLGASDIPATAHVAHRAAEAGADVLHGHGAKGGAYARLARNARAIRVYTPHGGSLHFSWGTPAGFLYLAAERALMRRTDLFLFESGYGRDVFRAKLGDPRALTRVVHNGVGQADFDPVEVKPDASDLVFVGELRLLKGVDVLIEAVALLAREGRSVTAAIAGDGPDRAAFEAQAKRAGVPVRFLGRMPARSAFALGRLLIVPSRAESLPYIVLEAGAAAFPMLASDVGGMREIVGPDAGLLVPPDAPAALARAIAQALQQPEATRATAQRLRARIRESFSAEVMTDAVLAAYRCALALRNG